MFMTIIMALGMVAAVINCLAAIWDRNINAAIAWGVAGGLSLSHFLRYLAELSKVAG